MFKRWLMMMVFAPADDGGGAGGGAAGGGSSSVAGGAGAAAGGSGGSPAPAFAETLPQDIRGEASFKDIKDLDGLARGFLNAQKLIGHDPKNLIALPGPDDTAGWDAVHARLGRPEKADGYKFTEAKLPEGLTIDPGLQTSFQAEAHKIGLSDKQADALFQWWNGTAGAKFTADAAARAQGDAAGITALKTEWGTAFDERVDLAKQAVAHYGGEALVAELDKTGLGNAPNIIKAFAKAGIQLQEDGLIGKGGGGGGGTSPAEAQQQINALRADAQFAKAYMDKDAPGHADAVAKMKALHEIAYPEQVKA